MHEKQYDHHDLRYGLKRQLNDEQSQSNKRPKYGSSPSFFKYSGDHLQEREEELKIPYKLLRDTIKWLSNDPTPQNLSILRDSIEKYTLGFLNLAALANFLTVLQKEIKLGRKQRSQELEYSFSELTKTMFLKLDLWLSYSLPLSPLKPEDPREPDAILNIRAKKLAYLINNIGWLAHHRPDVLPPKYSRYLFEHLLNLFKLCSTNQNKWKWISATIEGLNQLIKTRKGEIDEQHLNTLLELFINSYQSSWAISLAIWLLSQLALQPSPVINKIKDQTIPKLLEKLVESDRSSSGDICFAFAGLVKIAEQDPFKDIIDVNPKPIDKLLEKFIALLPNVTPRDAAQLIGHIGELANKREDHINIWYTKPLLRNVVKNIAKIGYEDCTKLTEGFSFLAKKDLLKSDFFDQQVLTDFKAVLERGKALYKPGGQKSTIFDHTLLKGVSLARRLY